MKVCRQTLHSYVFSFYIFNENIGRKWVNLFRTCRILERIEINRDIGTKWVKYKSLSQVATPQKMLQRSMMDFFAKKVNGQKSLTVCAKSSIIDLRRFNTWRIYMSYRTVSSTIWGMFSKFLIFCRLILRVFRQVK